MAPEASVIAALLAWVAFLFFDAWAYDNARWPERMYRWYYKLPGGGFAALYTLGRDPHS